MLEHVQFRGGGRTHSTFPLIGQLTSFYYFLFNFCGSTSLRENNLQRLYISNKLSWIQNVVWIQGGFQITMHLATHL